MAKKEKCMMQVWLHRWEGNETGWNAWSLGYQGFATWAPTRDEVLLRMPGKLAEYRQWLTGYGVAAAGAETLGITIMEEVSGNEVAFTWDLDAAESGEISRCRELLRFTRQDLLATIEGLSDLCLDWDPPYQRFAEWAWWHTIRQILAHCALTEIGYYLPKIGYSGIAPAALIGAHWREQLQHSRHETERFLADLDGAIDTARVTRSEEVWSVRKVLRRLVWHELLHWKSITRIVRDYSKSMTEAR
jgi:hypothetical protein